MIDQVHLHRPQGREQIRHAVIVAARELVAERGPDGVTVREIAARAGVNHALVHRHFGTKAVVLQEVLTREAADVAEAVTGWLAEGLESGPEQIAGLIELLAEFPTYWRALVHAVLESPDVAVPGTAVTTDLFRTLWADTAAEKATGAAVAGATVLGWLVFGQFISAATGADPNQVRQGVADQIAGLTGTERHPERGTPAPPASPR